MLSVSGFTMVCHSVYTSATSWQFRRRAFDKLLKKIENRSCVRLLPFCASLWWRWPHLAGTAAGFDTQGFSIDPCRLPVNTRPNGLIIVLLWETFSGKMNSGDAFSFLRLLLALLHCTQADKQLWIFKAMKHFRVCIRDFTTSKGWS